jgi:hypothetical protein
MTRLGNSLKESARYAKESSIGMFDNVSFYENATFYENANNVGSVHRRHS